MSQYTVTVTFHAVDKDQAEALRTRMASTYPSMMWGEVEPFDVEPVCVCYGPSHWESCPLKPKEPSL